jgi:hypothetical protein
LLTFLGKQELTKTKAPNQKMVDSKWDEPESKFWNRKSSYQICLPEVCQATKN